MAQTNQVHPVVANPQNVLEAGLRGGGGLGECNVPTDGVPSPLFGAEPFTQKMFREEAFGTRDMQPMEMPG